MNIPSVIIYVGGVLAVGVLVFFALVGMATVWYLRKGPPNGMM